MHFSTVGVGYLLSPETAFDACALGAVNLHHARIMHGDLHHAEPKSFHLFAHNRLPIQ